MFRVAVRFRCFQAAKFWFEVKSRKVLRVVVRPNGDGNGRTAPRSSCCGNVNTGGAAEFTFCAKTLNSTCKMNNNLQF